MTPELLAGCVLAAVAVAIVLRRKRPRELPELSTTDEDFARAGFVPSAR